MLKYPNINPEIIHIYGPMAIRWYSLAYVFGFVLSIMFFKRQNKKLNIMSDKLCENFLTWTILGLLLGARIFYCLFYNFGDILKNPLAMFKVWEGGMSFHGGLIGLLIGVFGFGKVNKVNSWRVLDLCVITIPLALFFGRIANFINGELYGHITYTSPFRMVFPTDITQQPRHPSQLYEAFSEGLCLFLIMFLLFKKTKMINYTGISTGIFGVFYAIFRFICEFFRRPEIDGILGFFTAGQFLSVIMLIFSLCWIYFWWKWNKKYNKTIK